MGLARQAAAQASGDDSSFLLQTEAAAREILADAEQKGLTSPDVGSRILREVRIRSGVSDPYAEFKAREMAQAQKVFSRIKIAPGDDLRSRASLAVLGNSIDFFTNPDEALSQIPEEIRKDALFFHDDIDRLEGFLSAGPGLVLYLTDNAGEIYFDQLLYEYIQERAGRTVLVVKGGPALNDVTRAELKVSGLDKEFSEVADTGTDAIGIDWKHVSKGFLDLIDQADLVVAKGMANFESMYPRGLRTPVFFVFKAKCRPMQHYLKAPGESYWALWRDGYPTGKVP
jgi:uncharacterized protein with ATP-grasp and redox domains